MTCHNKPVIVFLARVLGGVKGVDSTAASHEALDAAKQLAKEYQCIVAVSGAIDLVSTLNPTCIETAHQAPLGSTETLSNWWKV